jgi:glycosyltransferase involved in cell wall biosynthesis
MKHPEQKGLISIIVPIYNVEVYLRECLDSVLAQTFTNWEAILVNDGSPDNSRKIIDEYVKKDSRFIAIHKKQNEGLLLARKTGLENSKGEFIANLDSDDMYHPQFLEKMYVKITETNSDFVWCKFQIPKNQEEKYKSCFNMTDYKWSIDKCENITNMIMYKGTNWSLCNKLIKKDIYTKTSFPNEHLIMYEDGIQMLQIAYHSKSAAFVPEELYLYRAGVGVTATFNRIPILISSIFIKKTLENLFNEIIPKSIKNTFYFIFRGIPHYYYLLNKKQRIEFKNELEPIIIELIKRETKLNLKICLFLASKGIEFPFKLREYVRIRIYLPIKKWFYALLLQKTLGEKNDKF